MPNYVKISELVKKSGFKYSTLKYYAEIGILPYVQDERLKDRHFDLASSLQRLKEIKKLREVKRRTISEIIEFYRSRDK
jgi:DNA-binding transcriptional MerR regulator